MIKRSIVSTTVSYLKWSLLMSHGALADTLPAMAFPVMPSLSWKTLKGSHSIFILFLALTSLGKDLTTETGLSAGSFHSVFPVKALSQNPPSSSLGKCSYNPPLQSMFSKKKSNQGPCHLQSDITRILPSTTWEKTEIASRRWNANMGSMLSKALCSGRKYGPERRHCSEQPTHSFLSPLPMVSPWTSHPTPWDHSDAISTKESVPACIPGGLPGAP